MKAWTLAVVLLAAVLADKALARPNDDADEDDEGFQRDSEPAANPILRSKPVTLTPKPGETVQLPCEVENPPPSIIWLNGTTTLSIGERRLTFANDKRISIHSNYLEIQDIQPYDTGSYTCKVSANLVVVHEVNVYAVPRIVSLTPSERPLVVEKGQRVDLRCKAVGFPEPHVIWERKGRNLPGKLGAHHTGEHLHFADVGARHSGTYVCRAQNAIGEVRQTIDLLVSDGPEVDMERSMVNTDVGKTAEIVCTVHAHPPAKVTWFFSGNADPKNPLVPNSNLQMLMDEEYNKSNLGRRHLLRIERVTEKDLGVYYCLADNGQGTARRPVKLAGIPSPAVLQQVSYENGSPVLWWTVESLAPINKYELMYRKKNVTDWTTVEIPASPAESNLYKVRYELKDIERLEYEAKLKSHNSFGWSDLSEKYPFEAGSDSSKQAAPSRKGVPGGNGAPVDRITSSLLLGALTLLLSRSLI